jgi:hypothetical protein
MPEADRTQPITVTAQTAGRWQLGVYDVWVLSGDCVIRQAGNQAQCREAVLWIDRAGPTESRPHKVIAYLEGDVVMSSHDGGGVRLTDQTWFGRLESTAAVEVRPATVASKPGSLPAIYWRGMERRRPEPAQNLLPGRVEAAQFNTPVSPVPSEQPAVAPTAPLQPAPPPMAPSNPSLPVPTAMPLGGTPHLPSGVRRVSIFPRSNVPVNGEFRTDPATNRQMAWITSGVNVVVETEGTMPGLGAVGTIDVSADRVVIWTSGLSGFDPSRPTVQDQRAPLEFYLEGNIVFRQGERTIYADRMYYDVTNQVGTVINADMLTPVWTYRGLLRLHADVVRQTGPDNFFAQRAFITSSRIGEPAYRLQAGDIYFEDIQSPIFDPNSGLPVIDPATGQQAIEHQRMATASNNVLFVGPVPVFYWPMLGTDLNDPTYYIRRVRIKNDGIFGTQALTDWSGYELLGIRKKPVGTDFNVSLDYMSKRGFGHGGDFSYDREGVFGIPGHVAGLADYWGIPDHGFDVLGQYRMHVPPEKSYRYRLFWQHRQMLPYDLRLSAETGWISDRNFLEEYYKAEWEQLKDQTTGLELKRITENRDWSITADYRLNDFFTQTDWLPRGDHYWLGQDLFRALTWFEHSQAAYARMERTTTPPNPWVGADHTGRDGPFNYMPWEAASRRGERLATRQEIDWPFQLGVVKFVPYALGEAARWGEDINGDAMNRLYGQVGARASVPFWSVDPSFNSDMLNVHGIAHKLTLEAEFSYADCNRDMDQLPLYDPLDDDSVEAFRRRFLTTTFGIPSMSPTPIGVPWAGTEAFDPRFYALRTGLQNWVTSPSTEIADDLMAARLGVKQRWQTKRGPPANRRIIDWVTLDTNMTFFPKDSRDDFGQPLGLLDYDFIWHVGDRLTFVSDGIFDFFDEGQKLVTVGGFLNRPPRGSLYAGFRILDGPIHNRILSLSYSYWMSPKWISAFGTSIDLTNNGNIGQNFTITRIGESFLISLGFNVDAARKSTGVGLAIEPRFLPQRRLGAPGGAQIPPAGTYGLD